MKDDYLVGDVPEELDGLRRFWDGTSGVYSDAKLTTEGGEDIEAIIPRLENVDKLICLGVATGCRDPLVLLDSGNVKPRRIVVNDLSPKLLGICYQNLRQYLGPETDLLAVEGAIHSSLHKQGDAVTSFLGEMDPLFALGVYRGEILHRRFNSYSALELYSEERENIGENLSVCSVVLNEDLGVDASSRVDLRLPITPKELGIINEYLEDCEHEEDFGGFQVQSEKDGNPFISHYYTMDCLYQLLTRTFPQDGYEIEIIDTGSRNYVAFVKRLGKEQNGLITMINNVLGNIPLNLQSLTLESVRDTFYA